MSTRERGSAWEVYLFLMVHFGVQGVRVSGCPSVVHAQDEIQLEALAVAATAAAQTTTASSAINQLSHHHRCLYEKYRVF